MGKKGSAIRAAKAPAHYKFSDVETQENLLRANFYRMKLSPNDADIAVYRMKKRVAKFYNL